MLFEDFVYLQKSLNKNDNGLNVTYIRGKESGGDMTVEWKIQSETNMVIEKGILIIYKTT